MQDRASRGALLRMGPAAGHPADGV